MSSPTRSSNRSQQQDERREPPLWSRRYWSGSGHIEVAVWSRMIGEGDDAREVLNTTLRKTYKDGDDYKDAKSYRPEELPLIAFVLQEAFRFISDQNAKE